jgi:hypothetical protein
MCATMNIVYGEQYPRSTNSWLIQTREKGNEIILKMVSSLLQLIAFVYYIIILLLLQQLLLVLMMKMMMMMTMDMVQ